MTRWFCTLTGHVLLATLLVAHQAIFGFAGWEAATVVDADEIVSSSDIFIDEVHNSTTVFEAVREGDMASVERLLAQDAGIVNSADNLGWTPLHWAALHGRTALTERLLAGRAVVDAKEQWGCTPLHWAARRGHMALLRLLLEHGANSSVMDVENRTATTWARLTGHEYAAAFLEGRSIADDAFEQLGHVNNSNDAQSHRDLIDAASSGHHSQVVRLLDLGVAMDARDEWDATALHAAAENGHASVVAALLGAARIEGMLSSVDKWGRTPLLVACSGPRGDIDVVKALVQHRAQVNALDPDLRTPIHWATLRGSGSIVSLLLQHGASLEHTDRWGRGLLHHAAANGHMQLLKAVIATRASLDLPDTAGQTPMHLAAAGGHTELLSSLVSAGANVKAVDLMGRASLHYGALLGHDVATARLLELRAGVHAQDRDGMTALSLSTPLGQADIARSVASRK